MARFLAGWRQREVFVILGLALAIMILWRVPALGLLFYPFHLFSTFIHELSHGLAAIATGGVFQHFEVNSDLGGVAWSSGGIAWIVTSAGYIGSAIFGGLLVLLSSRGVSSRSVLFFLGVALGV